MAVRQSTCRKHRKAVIDARRGNRPALRAKTIVNAESQLDLHRFRSGRVLMLGGLLFEGHG